MQAFPQVNYIKCSNGTESYRMSYTAWGKQVAGCKTLICVHGLNRNCRDFDFVAQHFVKLGYYVIAPDIVGRGNSDYLVNWTGYSIPFYVNDVLNMIKTLKLGNIDFLGTSMGGMIGMSIALLPNHPIRKLILNDIGAEVEILGLERIGAYSNTQPEFDTLEEASESFLAVSKEFAVPPELEEFYVLTSFQKNNKGKYELKRDLNISKGANPAMLKSKNMELWEIWKKVNIDTLIIHGASSDILLPVTIARMKEINPKTQSVTLENAGHAPYLYSESHMQLLQKFLFS
jgi:pimeloyl-ACP methyl ester carboxylesterase